MTPHTEQEAIVTYLGPIATREPSHLIIRQIPPALLHEMWPMLAPDVVAVVDRARERWTVAHIAEMLITGQWQTWIVWDGEIQAVLATELYHEPSDLKCARAVFVGGRDMKRWAHLMSDLEDWARSEGCARFDMIISKGIAKHFPEYRMSHVLLEKDLT